jgi:hypothetical protein
MITLVCVIIFASDISPAVTREIRNHEYAHCNGWSHPEGWATKTKAYVPPRRFLAKFAGKVYENPVSSRDARGMCDGDLGCTRLFKEGDD